MPSFFLLARETGVFVGAGSKFFREQAKRAGLRAAYKQIIMLLAQEQ